MKSDFGRIELDADTMGIEKAKVDGKCSLRLATKGREGGEIDIIIRFGSEFKRNTIHDTLIDFRTFPDDPGSCVSPIDFN